MPQKHDEADSPQVRGDATRNRHNHSGAVCAGSNPAGGTPCEVPKDPVTSGNAEAGVFVYVQACAARSGRMSGSVDEAWTGSRRIVASNEARWRCGRNGCVKALRLDSTGASQ
ncbi:hypothetical protein GCM10023177_54120 [Streptomyces violaceoruber]|nr:hypothetical protein JCM4020_54420 [Streptomyces coelicolor]